VSYRVRVRVSVPKFAPQAMPARSSPLPPTEAIKGMRFVHFSADVPMPTTIYDRERIGVGTAFAGPAIVEQFDATTVVPAGWTATVDRYLNLVLERGGARAV
jgi:N-methylhydantoinase A